LEESTYVSPYIWGGNFTRHCLSTQGKYNNSDHQKPPDKYHCPLSSGYLLTEVNKFASKVKEAGGNIFHEVRRNEANYYGFAFADPDGHKFNVLLMDNM
jgi:predicted lactoylglutathione lyase